MKITLLEWADLYFKETKPSIYTLRRWDSQGLLQPSAMKIGRTLYVESDTVFVGRSRADLGKERAKKAAKK